MISKRDLPSLSDANAVVDTGCEHRHRHRLVAGIDLPVGREHHLRHHEVGTRRGAKVPCNTAVNWYSVDLQL